MEISATFIGQNSLGYIKGQTYILKVTGFGVKRLDGSGFVIYTSLRTFLLNWDNIKTR